MVIRPLIGSHIVILLGTESKDKIRDLIAKEIPFRDQPQKSWVDNAATWLTNKVPLEKPS